MWHFYIPLYHVRCQRRWQANVGRGDIWRWLVTLYFLLINFVNHFSIYLPNCRESQIIEKGSLGCLWESRVTFKNCLRKKISWIHHYLFSLVTSFFAMVSLFFKLVLIFYGVSSIHWKKATFDNSLLAYIGWQIMWWGKLS